MKHSLQRMLLAALMTVPLVCGAQNTLTVADGTENSIVSPFYGDYADIAQHNQLIYPADSLTAMVGQAIKQMVFYIDTNAYNGPLTDAYIMGTWTVSIGTTTETTLTGLVSSTSLTEVYQGYFDCSTNYLTLVFNDDFIYDGGNLLIDIQHPESGLENRWTFLGVSSYATSYVNLRYVGGQFNFMPKVTFIYDNPPTCFRPHNLTANNITSNGLILSWIDTINDGASYTIDYWKDGRDSSTITSNTTSCTILGLEQYTHYNFAVKATCAPGEESRELTGSFSTLCADDSCVLNVSVSPHPLYISAYVCLYQNNTLRGTVKWDSERINVCSGDSVELKYFPDTSQYNLDFNNTSFTVSVVNSEGTTIFTGHGTETASTLAYITKPCPTCLSPTGLHIDSVSTDEVHLSWTAQFSDDHYVVYLGDSIVNNDVTDTFFVFANLSPNKVYTLRVQSVCSLGDSSSIASINASTTCGTMTLPFFEDFNNYPTNSFPECWHSPSPNNIVYDYSILIFNHTSFITPSAVPLMGNQIHVSYDVKKDSENFHNGWLKAGVMTDYNDHSTFIALDSVQIIQFESDTVYRDFNTSTLDSNANYYIAWMLDNSENCFIDNILITEDNGCERPAAVYAPANITTHSVDLSWKPVAGVSDYTVYYGTENNPNSARLLSESVSDTIVTLTGLLSNTLYYAWVKSNCGGGNIAPIRPFASFRTPVSCPAVTGLTADNITADGATIHWTAGGEETQWEVALDNNDYEFVTDTFYTITGLYDMTGHTFRVRPVCDDGDTGVVSSTYFSTRCYNATCNITAYVTDIWDNGWNGSYIKIVQNNTIVGTIVCPPGQSGSTFNYGVCSSEPVTLILGDNDGYFSDMDCIIRDGGGNVVFSSTNYYPYNIGDTLATIDTPCPDCFAPIDITVDAITENEATIHWLAQEGQTNWIVVLDRGEAVAVTDNFYTFRNLEPLTTHTAHIATDCGDDTSIFANFTFTTKCDDKCNITVDMTSSSRNGWYYSQLNFSQNGVPVGYTTLTGVNSATATLSVCSGMPLTFNWHTYSTTGRYSYVIYDGIGDEVYNSDISGLYVNETIPGACPTCARPADVRVTNIDTTSLSFSWTRNDTVVGYLISFNGEPFYLYSGDNYSAYNLTPNTAYTFAVKTICSSSDTSFARTIKGKTAMTCNPIFNLRVTNVGYSLATLRWEAPANENHWEIRYGNGLTARSYYNIYTLRNLTPTTTYAVKVRALCCDTMSSEWSDSVVFTTLSEDGIDDVYSAHIHLYPNPASTEVTLTGLEGKSTVSVVDMNGRTVSSTEMQGDGQTIDVSELAKGAYFVRIVGEQVSAIRKLIIR